MTEQAMIEQLQEQLSRMQAQLNAKRSTITTSSGGLPDSKQLDGKNYNEWKFLMKNFLIDAGLWRCIETPDNSEIDPDLDQRALAKINLSIKPTATGETKKCKTAKEAWESLRNTYEDKGIVRRIGLYAALFKTKYSDFDSMFSYIEHVTSVAEQLEGIGKPLDDETVGGIILGGLPEKFRPLILGIQGSNQTISVDFVKALLLQDNVKNIGSDTCRPTNSAFQGRLSHKSQNKSIRTRKPRCYNCNDIGHYSSQCKRPPKRGPKLRNDHIDRPTNLFVDASETPHKPNYWYLDSGCNAHMTPRRDWMANVSPIGNKSIDVANGNTITTSGTGTVNLMLSTNKTANVENVIHAPDLTTNLLSVSQIAKTGKTVIFDKKGCRISTAKVDVERKSILATATEDRGLYRLDVKTISTSIATLNTHDVWHRRLAHLNRQDMKKLASMAVGMKPEPDPKVQCISCLKGKQHRIPFPKTNHRSQHVLGLIHSDLCGPMQEASVGGASYFLTFIDDCSRKSFVYFLKNKDEVIQKFQEFKAFAENQTDRKIKSIRSDNGGEYIGKEIQDFLKNAGIHHQFSVPRTPQQNGVAERLNRTLVEKARTMLFDANLPKKLWAEAVNTANYLRNRSPTKALHNITPEEAWTGIKPNLSHLRIFGCKVFVHVHKSLRKKWDSKAEEKIFVGYSESSKGYRVVDPSSLKISIARDVAFLENEFSNHATTTLIERTNQTPTETEPDQHFVEEDIPTTTAEQEDEVIEHDSADEDEDIPCPQKRILIPNRRIFNDDFIVYQAQMCTNDPQTYEEASKRPDSPKWKKAAKEEVEAHIKNKSWEYCELPPGKTAIKSRWTFKTKYDSNGKVDKYKVRLVAKGCSQQHGINYEETFSPTVRHNSIRFLLSLAAKFNLKIHQMDVVTAFLHPVLEEEIYMELPNNPEFFKHKYCKLKKSVYGLKQASRVWYHRLDKALCEMGLKRSKADPCVYFKSNGNNMLIIAVYVDDILIFSNNDQEKKNVQQQLQRQFSMKDLGEASYILGMKITQDKNSGNISLDQSNYLKNLLKRFGMDDCKAANTPLACSQVLTKDMSPKTSEERKEMENIPYREAIGSLLYASQGTRPDICHAVGILSRFSTDPGIAHWSAVKRTFRYLKGTIDKKLHFFRNSPSSDLHGYSDSDWANDREDRRSTTGYVFCNSGGAISWCSKKQPTVALSTTEAEYMALSSTTQEILWLTQLRQEILKQQHGPIPIHCDNKGAIVLSANRILSPRTKHIDIRHHFLREKIADGVIEIKFVDSKNNAADMLTKSVPDEQFQSCLSKIGLE